MKLTKTSNEEYEYFVHRDFGEFRIQMAIPAQEEDHRIQQAIVRALRNATMIDLRTQNSKKAD
jgi:hypothetical protein